MKRRFKADIFRYQGKKMCQLVDQETGGVFYVEPPKRDTRGKRLAVGAKCWATLGKDRRLYYTRILRKPLSKKAMLQIFAEIDRLFPQK